MIHSNLFDPKSIMIVGGSQNTFKPGGKIIENLKEGDFKGNLFVVNPKAEEVQGIKSYSSIEAAPLPDLAILAIPAKFCPISIEQLCQKGCRAFIVISAGFGELNEEGKSYDKEILSTLEKFGASLLGPNCIGLIHENHHSVFTTPIPNTLSSGIEFISSSGSTAVFIMEAGMITGLPFSNVYTVGNALQLKVEDFLAHIDEKFEKGKSSEVIMIYIEDIHNPSKLIRHAQSLIRKGAKIVALKAGMTEAGSRAASSHTGAMASPSIAVEAMFKKARIIQCNSRQELLYAASILLHGLPNGNNMAVITHAGGAGVMLTDALENGGIKIPEIKAHEADELLNQLYPGSSVSNPIDFLATGTAEQLGLIIDHCQEKLHGIDTMAVIFGSPGLFDVKPVYRLLDQKMKAQGKTIYPILPSPVNTEDAIEMFISKGNHFYPDEAIFGQVFAKLIKFKTTIPDLTDSEFSIDKREIRALIDNAGNAYLAPSKVSKLLKAAGIPVIPEYYAKTQVELLEKIELTAYPLVMKVVGPLHKSDLGGVILNIRDESEALASFEKLMKIGGAVKVLIQAMIKGIELFIGANREDKFGHLLMFGMGGIFLEIQKDVQSHLIPLRNKEIIESLEKLKAYPILKGIRGQKGIDLPHFSEIIERLSLLLEIAPEIQEMDMNPLIASDENIYVVDARILIHN